MEVSDLILILFVIAQVALIVLKLFDYITFSWVLVLFPAILFVLLAAVATLVILLAKKKEDKSEEK